MTARSLVTFSRSVDQFMVYAEVRRKMRASTLQSYRWVLEQTVELIGRDVDPATITETDLDRCLLAWRACSSSTIAGRVSVWHSYFKWMSKEVRILDVSRDIERPTKRKPAVRWISPDEFQLLLLGVENEEDTLILLVLGWTGVRRAEFRDLRWRDVDLAQRILTVRDGKGGKSRQIPLRQELAAFLAAYRRRDAYRAGDADGDYLVDRRHTISWTYKRITRAAKRGGVALPVGNHALRRMFARDYLAANPGEIYSLKAILGHESIDTTHGYAGAASFDLARAGVDRMGDPDVPRKRDPLVEDLVVGLTGEVGLGLGRSKMTTEGEV